MTGNKRRDRIEELQRENWQLTYRLDKDLRAKFESNTRYVAYQKTRAAIERLRETLREQELGNRRIDRQLTHVEGELRRLSKLLETVREHARTDAKGYREAMDEALLLLSAQNEADE